MNKLSNEQRIGIGIAILLIIGLIIYFSNQKEEQQPQFYPQYQSMPTNNSFHPTFGRRTGNCVYCSCPRFNPSLDPRSVNCSNCGHSRASHNVD